MAGDFGDAEVTSLPADHGVVVGFVGVAWDGALRDFYLDSCGFTATDAGLIAL